MTGTDENVINVRSTTAPGDPSAQPEPPIFRDVLCAIDGTRTSYRSVARACELMAPDAHLTILVCTHESGAGAWASAEVSPERARRALSKAAEIAGQAGIAAETVLDPRGPAIKRVLERAASHPLLALGAPIVPRWAGLWIGGVALHAVHHLPSSLLIAREAPLPSADQIVLALDGSDEAPGLIEIAAHAARRLGRGIVAVHAVGVESRSERHHLEAGHKRLTEALGAPPELVVEAEHPADLILSVAARRTSSLIIMGSRRVGGVRALGSVSERVTHRTRCSVLVVRPEERGS